MKKKEIVIIALIAAVSFVLLIVLNRNGGTAAGKGSASDQAYAVGDDMADFKSASGVTVAVQHRDQIVLVFDPAADAIYHIEGDVGGLDVEVKDDKWHVTNEQCPNHVCAGMGWMGPDDIIPITCLPNNVMIYVEDSAS